MRLIRWVTTFTLLAVVGAAAGAPLNPFTPRILEVAGFSQFSLHETFTAGERSLVMVSGDGSTAMQLYIYDAHGNCVAKDEPTHQATQDDLAAQWYPATLAGYLVVVRNAGPAVNRIQFAVR